MRVLLEIFTLVVGIGMIFAISKGFPQFGRVLAFLIYNPFGLLATVGVIAYVVLRRRRASSDA